MAKAYIQYRTDIASAAALDTYVAANPTQFTPGTLIMTADGTLHVIKHDLSVGDIALT